MKIRLYHTLIAIGLITFLTTYFALLYLEDNGYLKQKNTNFENTATKNPKQYPITRGDKPPKSNFEIYGSNAIAEFYEKYPNSNLSVRYVDISGNTMEFGKISNDGARKLADRNLMEDSYQFEKDRYGYNFSYNARFFAFAESSEQEDNSRINLFDYRNEQFYDVDNTELENNTDDRMYLRANFSPNNKYLAVTPRGYNSTEIFDIFLFEIDQSNSELNLIHHFESTPDTSILTKGWDPENHNEYHFSEVSEWEWDENSWMSRRILESQPMYVDLSRSSPTAIPSNRNDDNEFWRDIYADSEYESSRVSKVVSQTDEYKELRNAAWHHVGSNLYAIYPLEFEFSEYIPEN